MKKDWVAWCECEAFYRIGRVKGYIRGFQRGQKITEAIAQHETITAMAFFLLGSVIALLIRLV